jgi:uncharacterized protein (DUF1810 family)
MTIEMKLGEFVDAQAAVYEQVVRELTAGQKRSHWMWFIFPQLAGLGSSHMARKFAIQSLEEARAYLQHAVLGPRLKECTRLMLDAPGNDVSSILGYPDDLKFRSCMTLFAAAEPREPLFQSALDKFFGGQPDSRTLEILNELPDAGLPDEK